MADSNRPSPGIAFLLALVWPPLGYRYSGRPRLGQIAHMVWLALLGLGIAVAMLPPVNLPVLILMALPPVGLVVWWLAGAAGAAVQAGKGQGGTAPRGLGSPVLLLVGAIVSAAEVCGAALLAYSLTPAGIVTTPNDDMAPTLLEGERILTWKDYYKDRLPERGDVAVVRLPGIDGPRIMRIVGLPGDSLIGVLGVLTINGEAVGRQRDGDFSWRDAGGTHRNAPRYRETLPGGTAYGILQSAEGMLRGTLLGANLRIPDGHYFAIGDNRDRTASSWDFGFLPGLVLSDRPTVILSSPVGSRIGRSVQPH